MKTFANCDSLGLSQKFEDREWGHTNTHVRNCEKIVSVLLLIHLLITHQGLKSSFFIFHHSSFFVIIVPKIFFVNYSVLSAGRVGGVQIFAVLPSCGFLRVGLLLSRVPCLVLPCCLPGFPPSLSVSLGPRLLSFSVLLVAAWRKFLREFWVLSFVSGFDFSRCFPSRAFQSECAIFGAYFRFKVCDRYSHAIENCCRTARVPTQICHWLAVWYASPAEPHVTQCRHLRHLRILLSLTSSNTAPGNLLVFNKHGLGWGGVGC